MCFDSSSSLLAWTLSYSIAYFLFIRNRGFDRWAAGFLLCFTTIQLLEAGIWGRGEVTVKGDAPNRINSLLTMLILVTLLFQPVVQTGLGYHYTGQKWMALLCAVCLIAFGYGWYRLAQTKTKFQTTVGPNGHLIWSDGSGDTRSFLGPSWVTLAYMLGLFLPICYLAWSKPSYGIPLLLIGLATLFYSIKSSSSGEVGSLWCFMAVAYGLVALVI